MFRLVIPSLRSENSVNISGIGVALYCRDDFMPNKSEEGLSGLLNKKYSKAPENLIASYGNVDETEKVNAAIADDDGRTILTQHIVKVSSASSSCYCLSLDYGNEMGTFFRCSVVVLSLALLIVEHIFFLDAERRKQTIDCD